MIYAIEAIGGGHIKIGRAKSVGKRLKELETGNHLELGIIAVADWPDFAERAIHLYLQPTHAKLEWFRDEPLTREVIQWMVNGSAGLERLKQKAPIESRSLARSLASAHEVTNAERRLERRAWWRAKKHVQTQQSTAPMAYLAALIPQVIDSQ